MRIRRRSMFVPQHVLNSSLRGDFVLLGGYWTNVCVRSVLVKTWNYASFPGFKSRIWNSEATPDFKKSARPSASRSSSSANKVKTTS